MNKLLRSMCAVLLVLMISVPADACTSLRIKTTDGLVFYARTMEFAIETDSSISVIPKGTRFQGTLPDGTSKGLVWTAKYGFAGMNSAGEPVLIDGINDQGLIVGGLLFPGFAEYEPFDASLAGSTIAQYELINWILSNFATIDEVREGIKDVRVCQAQAAQFGPLPLHYVVHDASGDCIVIEHVKGKVHVYDNPLGVLTNSPPFDWMMINLRNFVNLTAVNVPELTIDGIEIKALGQGTGMLGLPGDYTPPHRFVRALALAQSALPVTGADDGLGLVMTIINNIDIPKGAVRDMSGKEPEYELTQWTVAIDSSRRRIYFRTYDNQNWRYVDVNKALTKARGITTISINIPADYPDVTDTAK